MPISQYIPNFGSFSLSSFVSILLWGTLLAAGLGFAIKFIRDKIKYQYQGEIFRRRQNNYEGLPQSTNVSGKAGYFKTKTGRTVFRIKWGLMPWQVTELAKLPDPNYMVGNKVYYLQLNKDNLVQAKIGIDWNAGLKLEPVEDDLKYGAMLDIYEKDRILDTKKLTPLTVGIAVMGFILVTGLIVYYFITGG